MLSENTLEVKRSEKKGRNEGERNGNDVQDGIVFTHYAICYCCRSHKNTSEEKKKGAGENKNTQTNFACFFLLG